MKEQKQKQKGSIKEQKENRGKEKREKERKEHRTGSVIEPKRRSIKKTEARAKEIAKKYQIEGSKKMKTNRKRTD